MNRKHAFQVGYFPYSLSRKDFCEGKQDTGVEILMFSFWWGGGGGVKHKMQVASPASQIHLIYKNFKMYLGCCSPLCLNPSPSPKHIKFSGTLDRLLPFCNQSERPCRFVIYPSSLAGGSFMTGKKASYRKISQLHR